MHMDFSWFYSMFRIHLATLPLSLHGTWSLMVNSPNIMSRLGIFVILRHVPDVGEFAICPELELSVRTSDKRLEID